MTAVKFNFLWQYLRHWAGSGPDLPAIHFKGKTVTWSEFDAFSDQLAGSFLNMGIKKGDIIATMLPASPEYLFTLMAADKIGAVICALDVKYKSGDLERFMSLLHPGLIVSVKSMDGLDLEKELLGISENLIVVGRPEKALPFDAMLTKKHAANGLLKAAKAHQNAHDGMLIVFTGGTTGVPKAALLSKINVAGMAHAEFLFLTRQLSEETSAKRLKSIVSLTPSHVGGTVELMGMGIVGGMEMFVNDTWSPIHVFETVDKEKVVWIGGVPTMFAIMLITPERKQYDLSSLELALLSGEKTELELLEQIREKICRQLVVGYGSTEAGAEVTFTEPGENLENIAAGFVGRPLPGYRIRIVDPQGLDLPPGGEGEVLVQSDYTIKSYFNMPEEDEQGFTADGFCKTGDLGMVDGNGGLYIKGRTKQIIRVGSYTVMPSEIEEIILQDPCVGMAAALGVPDRILGEVVWLIASPAPGMCIDEDHLITLCQNRLAKFKVPRRVISKPDIPLTHIGKIDRATLQKSIIRNIKEGHYGK